VRLVLSNNRVGLSVWYLEADQGEFKGFKPGDEVICGSFSHTHGVCFATQVIFE